MSKHVPRYRRKSRRKGNSSKAVKIVAAVVIVVLLVTGSTVFAPRLVHRCSNCNKPFFGTGYYANIVTDTVSALKREGENILCRSCAESNHAWELLAGKTLDDFKRPLFAK